MPIEWSGFVDEVRRGKRFLLTSHVRPDCDGLGSELGMAGLLQSLGKEVLIVNSDSVPTHLAFLDPLETIRTLGDQIAPQDLRDVDVMMLLDTSAWPQLGAMADVWRRSRAKKIIIDHHVSQDDMGGLVLKDPSAESTGRLVVEASEALGVPITAQVAQPLFAAIATDTGWFRFSSVTGRSLRAAARLIDAGAQPHKIFAALYEQNSLARLLLRGRILGRAETHRSGRVLVACATQNDLEVTGAEPSDTEDVVNMLLSVAGSEVAVLLQEQPDGHVKVSLRSRSEVDVRQVAERFGGGGHTAASGAMLTGPIDAAERTILQALKQVME